MRPQINSKESWLPFTAGGRDCRIRVKEVERVLSLQRQGISRIPFGLGGCVLGLFSFRGAVLPLVSLASAPGASSGEMNSSVTVLLLCKGEKRFGIAVNAVRALSFEPDANALSVSTETLYEGRTLSDDTQ